MARVAKVSSILWPQGYEPLMGKDSDSVSDSEEQPARAVRIQCPPLHWQQEEPGCQLRAVVPAHVVSPLRVRAC